MQSWQTTSFAMMTITSGTNVTTLKFYYDAEGIPFYLDYNGTGYYYVTNLQGDVVGIANSNGIVGYYEYDAWGRILTINSASSMEYSALTTNPLRYRGYIYDTETGFYYLQTRYYDPMIRRFINGSNNVLAELNVFWYMSNNPVNLKIVLGNDSSFAALASINVSNVTNQVSNMPEHILNVFFDEYTTKSNNISFGLFGYETRQSNGWESSAWMLNSPQLRIGFSSYTTSVMGKQGVLYAFNGTTSDIMNWFDSTTSYVGLGINIFDIVGAEAQIELLGVGAQISGGPLSIAANVNVFSGISITIGWTKDMGNGLEITNGITLSISTVGVALTVASCATGACVGLTSKVKV